MPVAEPEILYSEGTNIYIYTLAHIYNFFIENINIHHTKVKN